MKVSDFNYHLPEELIAIHPPKERGSTRLLVVDRTTQSIEHCLYKDVPNFLKANDLVVLNNTKVFKARLKAHKPSGKPVELLVLEKHGLETDQHRAQAVRYGKVRAGNELIVGKYKLEVVAVDLEDGTLTLRSKVPFVQILAELGELPLPPYMNRRAQAADEERYQAPQAKEVGSVAAPTASLNFTPELRDQLHAKGINTAEITLHIGQGTFQPIWVDELKDHKMHSEYFCIPEATSKLITETKAKKHKVLAVGTTVTRTLEFAAHLVTNDPATELQGEADIFIYPGYQFHMVDMLLTNFHAPKSTVLMMAAAFAGKELLLKAYQEAIGSKYSFLSYGDSMLIL